MTTNRTLIAGVGNIFLGDDGFGVEVARELARRPLPDHVKLVDIGIRGVHLAYELLDGWELLVLVDAASRGTTPGTVSVLEIDPDRPPQPSIIDAHGLAPHQVLALLDQAGRRPTRTLLVACEPADLTPGIGLSPAVLAAVPQAVRIVDAIVREEFPPVAAPQKEWSA